MSFLRSDHRSMPASITHSPFLCCSDPCSLPRVCHGFFSHRDQRYEGAGLRCGTVEYWKHTRLVCWSDSSSGWNPNWWALNINFSHVNCLRLRMEETSAISVWLQQRRFTAQQVPGCRNTFWFLLCVALHFYCLFTFLLL